MSRHSPLAIITMKHCAKKARKEKKKIQMNLANFAETLHSIFPKDGINVLNDPGVPVFTTIEDSTGDKRSRSPDAEEENILNFNKKGRLCFFLSISSKTNISPLDKEIGCLLGESYPEI